MTASLKTYNIYTTLYSYIMIDENTGEITLRNEVPYARSVENIYFKYNDKIYEGSMEYHEPTGTTYFNGDVLCFTKKYIAKSYKEKTSYAREVNSSSLSDYPKNGIKGDYWYELIE